MISGPRIIATAISRHQPKFDLMLSVKVRQNQNNEYWWQKTTHAAKLKMNNIRTSYQPYDLLTGDSKFLGLVTII